jgi:hypothetical protein
VVHQPLEPSDDVLEHGGPGDGPDGPPDGAFDDGAAVSPEAGGGGSRPVALLAAGGLGATADGGFQVSGIVRAGFRHGSLPVTGISEFLNGPSTKSSLSIRAASGGLEKRALFGKRPSREHKYKKLVR